MNTSLWGNNHPRYFWQCQPDLSEDIWQKVIIEALPLLGLTTTQADMDTVLALTLGEGRFGQDHWDLGLLKRAYYLVKPLTPRLLTRQLRKIYNHGNKADEAWPIERHYVDFLWDILRQIIILSGRKEVLIKYFWPENKRFAFVLTHDIETAAGQKFVETVADLEESLGFHSSFNFVPERYKLNFKLMDDLRHRGFEVGVHGLAHNGRLFNSKLSFEKKSVKINGYLKEWNAAGFRSELTHRQPEWMQALDIEYDLSFFDTDPFEPIPGGVMSIWPFFIGQFVELPYTLVQDYTLTSIIGENSPKIWLEKMDFIEKYHGMALINTHPDYLKSKSTWDIYHEFLRNIKHREEVWHALPRDAAAWWRARANSRLPVSTDNLLTVHSTGDELEFERASDKKIETPATPNPPITSTVTDNAFL